MRPAPVAAGFQVCRPGSVSRAANVGFCASAARETLSAMPLDVINLTNSRREISIAATSAWALLIGLLQPLKGGAISGASKSNAKERPKLGRSCPTR
jgi:fluoride ion exporter CrcB/FEX